MPREKNPLIAIDIETDGLEPAGGSILEIAAFELDEHLKQTGNSFHCINKAQLHYDKDGAPYVLTGDQLDLGSSDLSSLKRKEFGIPSVDKFVLDMHTDNGLWDACEDGNPAMLDNFTEWMSQFKKPTLFGSSVHFDKAWIEHHCPELKLNYRIVDVSSLVGLLDIRPEELKAHGKAAHRAVDDILRSIEIGKFYHNLLKQGY